MPSPSRSKSNPDAGSAQPPDNVLPEVGPVPGDDTPPPDAMKDKLTVTGTPDPEHLSDTPVEYTAPQKSRMEMLEDRVSFLEDAQRRIDSILFRSTGHHIFNK
jgi:hypothetical protein